MAKVACLCCDDTGWVCENHSDQPWIGPHACTCGGAGAPCPRRNTPTAGEPRVFQLSSSLIASKGWLRRFEERIPRAGRFLRCGQRAPPQR
jgi:hypothetical protein